MIHFVALFITVSVLVMFLGSKQQKRFDRYCIVSTALLGLLALAAVVYLHGTIFFSASALALALLLLVHRAIIGFAKQADVLSASECMPFRDAFTHETWIVAAVTAVEMKKTSSCCCSLHTLCLIAGITHAIFAVATFIVALVLEFSPDVSLPHVVTPVTQSIGLWVADGQVSFIASRSLGHNATLDPQCEYAGSSPSRKNGVSIVPAVFSYGELQTQYMIPAFFLLSALFQCSYPVIWLLSSKRSPDWSDDYYKDLNDGKIHKTHFIEYSISASLMMLIIYAQLGITDVSILALSFTATWACMMFGLLAEFFSEVDINMEIVLYRTFQIPVQYVSHACGWIVLLVVVGVAVGNLETNMKCVDNLKLPAFVRPITAVMFTLFSGFGIVQSVSLYRMCSLKSPKKDNEPVNADAKKSIAYQAEFSYIMLSLLAKTTLALGIFIGLYQVQQNGDI